MMLKCVSESSSCGVSLRAGEIVRCISGLSGPCGPGANCVLVDVCVLLVVEVVGMFVVDPGFEVVFVFELPPIERARELSSALVVSDVRTGGSMLGL